MIARKITKIIKDTIILDKKLLRDYGFYTAFLDFNKSILFRKNKGIGKKIYYLKYENLRKKFYIKYNTLIKKYCLNNVKLSKIKKDSNIYFFWWQGIDENTPKEIIQNLNSVKKNCGDHKVIVLSKDNVKKYVKIPDNIYDNLKRENITITNFSDILRVKLLSTYGGIWSDASFFWTKPLPDYIYEMPLFSIKHGLYSDWHLAKGFWTVGLLASGEECLLFKYMDDMFKAYWKEYDYTCCYLFLDVFLSIAYDNWKSIKDCIDRIPYNNKDAFFYYDNGTKRYSEKKYKEIMSNTTMFRNHIKMKKNFKTKNKEKTFYYQFYNDYLSKEKQ